ncbi:integral membrane sensor signal transduction histidine kinase [Sporocytophaga myxococcoides]|uniref:histidine kinase n=1 Tax=Sporocytophaga myxococcoides TaxID=153721 RepID=A0A098LG02_9BACT|nr:ATP-binding protein [Sporocytophaga myxococcoides]GAL85900.1 integral membrane sensor signal transduction histidine kinase [Sporocytophaga myxococcoides]
MKIRNKLTLQFTGIVFCILILFSICIYYAFCQYREFTFRKRLREKALNTAKILIEVDEINAELLKKLRRNYLQSLHEEYVRIYDKNNNLVYRDDTIRFKIPDEKLQKIRDEKKYSFRIEDRQFVGLDYKSTYVITASAIDMEGHKATNFLAIALAAGNLFGLIIIFFTGRFFSSRALSPISDIIHEVDNIKEGHAGLRLTERKGRDEIAQLANSFNQMFDRIEDTFEQQNKFIAHASHELRTPLTSITGEIEVALLKDRSTEEYKETLQSLLEESLSLTELSNKLLELIQADKQIMISEKVNLRYLLDRLEEEVLKRKFSRSLLIENHISKDLSDIEITGNEDLIRVAMINVIDNGFKYSDKDVNLKIFSKEPAHISFSISDEGSGIDKDELTKILKPFYRSRRTLSASGFGIGLSLTDKIIKLHGGTLIIKSVISKGTSVTITLPV